MTYHGESLGVCLGQPRAHWLDGVQGRQVEVHVELRGTEGEVRHLQWLEGIVGGHTQTHV